MQIYGTKGSEPLDAIPELSVIVISFNSPALLKRCLMSLERQTLQEGVEVLVVRHRGLDETTDEELRHTFPSAWWVCAPREYNVPQMRSLGVERSRGEVIAFLEDDCVATEAWCAALLKAHQSPHAAIGGAVEPGDYAKGLDWAAYFCEYISFTQPLPEGDAWVLPGTNVSYKRAPLSELTSPERSRKASDAENPNQEIAPEGFYEAFVHQALRQAGHLLKADSSLTVHNVNTWGLSKALRTRFHHGRGFAAMRVAGRSIGRRLPFVGLAVFLPVVQIGRITRQVVTRKRYQWRLVQAFPWVILLSISWSTGELAGYLLGPGDALERWR